MRSSNRSIAQWLPIVAIAISSVAIAISSTACYSSTKSPEEQYLTAFQQANDVYESTMVAIGRAYRDGLITQDQLDKLRVAGRATENSLRAFKAGFEAYLLIRSPDREAELAALLRNLSDAVRSLLTVWDSVRSISAHDYAPQEAA